jgi:hypothetical protein
LPDGLKEGSETKEDDAADVQVDDETGDDDPPSVVEILNIIISLPVFCFMPHFSFFDLAMLLFVFSFK